MDQKISPLFHDEPYLQIFTKFLRYGFLAWGGPIGQLALIEKELVHEQKLISVGYFNRLLAIYQAVPGPETHEICVHLGAQAKGWFGGLLAGLGFMLPGFVLMLFFSWFYVLYGLTTVVSTILIGVKPAVIAWIVRGGHQLSQGILINPVLWFIAIVAFFIEMLNINFIISILLSGALHILLNNLKLRSFLLTTAKVVYKYKWGVVIVLTGFLLTSFLLYFLFSAGQTDPIISGLARKARSLSLFLFGLKAGDLSFGSVYTVLSIIKNDAIIHNQWLTQSQFIDGLALAGSLPAPFVIVTTFVGYMASGLAGALLVTFGTFLPAFLIPIFGHKYLSNIVNNPRIRIFLDGVTAGVAGLIAADVLVILQQVLVSKLTIGVFIGSLIFIYRYRSPYSIVAIVAIGGLLSFLSLNFL